MIEIKGAGGKGGASTATTPKPPVNSLHSISYAKIVDVISEGEIKGLVDGMKSIYFDKVPLQNPDGTYNFEGVTVASTVGSINQAALTGFDAVLTEVSVGDEITHQTTGGKPGPSIVTLNPNIDKVQLKLGTNALYKTNTKTGRNLPFSIEFLIFIKKTTDSSWSNPFNGTTIDITGTTTAPYERQVEISFDDRSATWMVKVERVTLDKEELEDENSDQKKFNHNCRSYLNSYTEVTEARLSYPDTAYVATKVDASQFGSSIPSRSFLVDGIIVKVPSNYDPVTRKYTGVWNGAFKNAWTNNPAWILRHLLTNTRYGCGIPEQYIDDSELYIIAKHCDELVPSGLGDGLTEPRFTINTVLSTQEDVNTAISHITSVFAGMAFWDSNTIRTVADYDSDVVTTVTKANVVDGEFNYTSSSIRERHSVALVTWNDPDSDYTSQVEIVEDRESIEQFGWKTIDVTAFGCTSRGQAHRLGRRILYSERVETETISYSAGLDHYKVRPGDIIQVSDPSKDGARYGGRVLAVNKNNVTLDSAKNTSVGDKIYFTTVNNTVNLHTVVSKVGDVVTVNGTVSTAIGSVWQSIPSVLTHLPRYRVVSVSEVGDGTYGITGVYHDPNKYSYIENNLDLPTIVVKKNNFNPAPPTSITHSESLEKNNNTVTTCLYTSWSDTKADGTSTPTSWSVRYRKNGGNWEDTIVHTRTIVLNNLSDDDVIEFHIRSRSLTGKASGSYASSTYSILGKTIPPEQVTGFVSSVISNGSVQLKWNNNPEVDINRYEIYKNSSRTGTPFYSGIQNSYLVKKGELTSGETLYIWAVDELQNYSVASSQLNVIYSNSATPVVDVSEDDSNDSNTFFVATWNDVEVSNGFDIKNYTVTVSRAGVTIRSLKTKSTQYRFQVKQAGVYTVSVVANDVFGQKSLAGSASKECFAPTAPTGLTVENKDNQLTLKWSDSVKGTLPIKRYLVSTSNSVWSGSSVIHSDLSTSKQITDLFTSSVKTVTLYVRAVDSAGNQSPSATITYTASSVAFTGTITKKVSDTSKTVANIKYKWPAASSPFGIVNYEVSLTGVVTETAVVSSLEWTTNLTWIGATTLSVVAVDSKGNKSAALTHTFTSSAPNAVTTSVVNAVTSSNGNITVIVDWEPATKGTLPIAGYEVRNTNSGFGTSGYVYKGTSTKATITTPLSTLATKSVYIQTFDTEGNYSTTYTVQLAVNMTPAVPNSLYAVIERNKLAVVYSPSLSIGVPDYDIAIGDGTNKTIFYSGTDNPARIDIVSTFSANVYIRAKYNGNVSAWSTGYPISYSVTSPANFVATVHNKRKLKLSWTASTSSVPIDRYVIEAGDNPTVTKTVKGSVTNCDIDPEWIGTKTISIIAIDKSGVSSAPATTQFTVNPPSAITGTISSNIVKQSSTSYTVTLDWENAAEGTFAIDGYDIKTVDANWDLDKPALKRVKGSSATIKTSSKAFTYYIRAYDKFGNYATSSVSLTKDGILPATISPSMEVIGGNVKISWATSGTDLDIKRFEIMAPGEGYRNLGDASSITVPLKTTTTYTIRAVDYDERTKEYQYTATIVQPTLSAPELTFLGATSVLVGTTTTSYHKIKADFAVPTCTYAIISYTITRKNRTGSTYTTVYEGNSNSVELLAYHDMTTEFKVYATDAAGNKSATISFSRDKVAPGKPASVSLTTSSSSKLVAGVSYNAPKDIREYEFKFYKFTTGTTPAADGSNWDSITTASATLSTSNQTCEYKLPKKWGTTLNITKGGVKYGVRVAVYDTSGNISPYKYSSVKVVKS